MPIKNKLTDKQKVKQLRYEIQDCESTIAALRSKVYWLENYLKQNNIELKTATF